MAGTDGSKCRQLESPFGQDRFDTGLNRFSSSRNEVNGTIISPIWGHWRESALFTENLPRPWYKAGLGMQKQTKGSVYQLEEERTVNMSSVSKSSYYFFPVSQSVLGLW